MFLSVGFETTTPSSCLSVKKAKEEQLENYSILTANKTMPGAYEALKGSADVFLYPGHVNAITGTALCESLTKWSCSRIYCERTADSIGCFIETLPGRKTIFCKLLSKSSNSRRKQRGTASCR